MHKFRKTPIEIHVINLCNKEIYCIFRTLCIIFYFLQNAVNFIIFFPSNNIFLYKICTVWQESTNSKHLGATLEFWLPELGYEISLLSTYKC